MVEKTGGREGGAEEGVGLEDCDGKGVRAMEKEEEVE